MERGGGGLQMGRGDQLSFTSTKRAVGGWKKL